MAAGAGAENETRCGVDLGSRPRAQPQSRTPSPDPQSGPRAPRRAPVRQRVARRWQLAPEYDRRRADRLAEQPRPFGAVGDELEGAVALVVWCGWLCVVVYGCAWLCVVGVRSWRVVVGVL